MKRAFRQSLLTAASFLFASASRAVIPQAVVGQDFRPTSLASADFDGDGIADLAAGYATADGRGLVVLLRGNVDAVYPHSPRARQRRSEGRFVDDPFLPTEGVFSLPAPPDFLQAGDFDADGRPDLASAARGGGAVHFLTGNGRGGFEPVRIVPLIGSIAAFAGDDIGRRDGLPDLLVGVAEPGALLLFQSPGGALATAPATVVIGSAPAAVASVRIGSTHRRAIAVRDERGRTTLVAESSGSWTARDLADAEELSVVREATAGKETGPDVVAELEARVSVHAVPGKVSLKADGEIAIQMPEAGAVITVNTAANNNVRDTVLTLNEAIRVANGSLAVSSLTPQEQAQVSGTPSTPGLDEIRFSVPVAGTPIHTGTLPAVSDVVTIDGTTQAGGWFEMSGNTGTGLNLAAGSSLVRGLAMYGWSDAISLDVVGGNVVEGNILGLNATGAPVNTNNTGIQVLTPGNTIGGTVEAARNVIANHTSYGIYVSGASATGNVIRGNFIGTDPTGSADPSSSAGRGIRVISGGGNTIGGPAPGAGNVISGNGSQGIRLDASGDLVQGNRVGTNAAGDSALANASYGVYVTEAGNTIGGTATGAGNVISGNEEDGVYLDVSAANTVVHGNRIGTNAAGTAAIPNVGHGVLIAGSPGNAIGGAAAGAGNLVSGNYQAGILLTNYLGNVPTGTVIQGNAIGTDATGTLAVPNLADGIELSSSLGTLLGGATAGAGNLISGNLGYGIRVSGFAAANPNLIRGNRIGTDVLGTGPLGNGLAGLYFSNNTSGHLAGGTAPDERNTIAFNLGPGVASASGRTLHLLPNRIFGNGGLGIDLHDDGPTPNSSGRSDNFPILTAADTSGAGTTVAGTLDAEENTTFDVYLFANPSCDPSGYGEGREPVAATAVTTDAAGHGAFSTLVTPALPGGTYVTAFAKAPEADGHDASEFSFCRQVAGSAPPSSTALSVAVIAPDRGGNTGPVTVKVTGTGILAGAALKLVRTGQPDVVAGSVSVAADGLSLTGVLALGGAAQGAWDVVIVNPDDATSALPGAFTVEAGVEPEIWADLLGRGTLVVRHGREQTFFAVFGNRGNTDSDPVKFRITVPWQLRVTHVDELDGARPVIAMDRPMVTGGTGDTTIEFFVRSIPANSSRSLAFRLLTIAAEPGEFGERLRLRIWHMTSPGMAYLFDTAPDPTVTLTPTLLDDEADHLRASIHVASSTVTGDVLLEVTRTSVPFECDPMLTKTVDGNEVQYRWRVAFSSSPPAAYEVFVSQQAETEEAVAQAQVSALMEARDEAMQNMADAIGADGSGGLSEGASALGPLADALDDLPQPPALDPGPATETIHNSPAQALCQAIRAQDEDAVESACGAVLDELDAAYGSCLDDLEAPLNCPLPGVNSTARYVRVFQAIDPNEKTGPSGDGEPDYWIGGGAPMAYVITFENLETATGAAQEVVITDQLDASRLDLSTLELGPVAFGTRVVDVPAGSRSFTGDVDLRPGVELIVRVLADLDAQTGLLRWRFFSLDPATGLPTENPALGFLPPNVDSPEGEGHVTFVVRPRPGLATGEVIHNQASIVFDANPPIPTQDWHNAVDVTPPSSQVGTLPATSCSAFSVSWSGSDAHSGVRDYDVYVSENGTAYVPWKSDTIETTDTFYGDAGSSYAFFCVARDEAGNVEPAPGSADAATAAGSPTPLVDVLTPSSGPAGGGVSVVMTGSGFETGAAVTVGGAAATDVLVGAPTSLTATVPALAAGALHDVAIINASGCSDTLEKGWLADFTDVDGTHLFHDFVEKILRRGVTAGCSGGNYCPGNPVTRAQMAVFLTKAKHEKFLTPPAASGTLFGDVPAGSFAADWIEQLAKEGVTGGCGGGNYCPGNSVTREQMAVFLLKSKYGSLFVPPAATGIFADVPPSDPFAPWIEQLAAEGITGGCGGGNYCPDNPVTRGQMAVFLSKTFGF